MTIQINELTQSQKEAMSKYVKKWCEIVLADTPKDFYNDDNLNLIKEAVKEIYKISNNKIDEENILIVESPLIAPFVAAAHQIGKIGKPNKKVKFNKENTRLINIDAVEEYLNGFKNPMEIIRRSSKYSDCLDWGIGNGDFCAFIDFFQQETNLKLKEFELHKPYKLLSELTHMRITLDNLCVVSLRPTHIPSKNSGEHMVADKGVMSWSNKTLVKVL